MESIHVHGREARPLVDVGHAAILPRVIHASGVTNLDQFEDVFISADRLTKGLFLQCLPLQADGTPLLKKFGVYPETKDKDHGMHVYQENLKYTKSDQVIKRDQKSI